MLDDGKTYYPPSSGMDEEYTTTVTGAPTLTLSNEAKSVAQTGEVGSLTISSSGSWSATTNAAWLRVSPAAGTSTTSGVVSYTVDANTATAGRSGIVTFNAAGLSKTFTATQAGKPADVLTTSGPDSYTISYLSGTGSFTLTANPSWSIASNATWLTVSQASGTSTTGTIVQYTATANETSASRTATLTVQAGSLSKVLTVVQDGVYFSTASPGSLTAPGGGLTGRFTFSATRPWKITPANAWVIASPMSGTAGTGVPVSYTIAANTTQQPRSTRLNIEEPGGSRQPYSVSVVQASILPVFGLSSTSTAGTSLAQTGTFSVSANVAWTATTDANWITLSQTSAVAGVSSLSYTASANSLPATRTGTITLTGRWTDVDAATKQVTAAHTVTQAALILSTEPTTLPGLTVSVYPNPTTDWVTARIHADKPQSVQISLYNAVGRLYQTRKADVLTGEQMITLDLRAAEAGMYVIRVENQEGQQLSQKIIRH